MIKRGRPARSRYRNLQEFIEIARSIHGDLYDYSETVLNGSQDPVSFKCNRCGTTRTLSQAQCHIRKNRPCGCKPCNHDRPSPCKICGANVSSKVYQKQNRKCKLCHDNYRQAKTDPWVLLAKREIRRNCLFDAWERKCRAVVGSFSRRRRSVKQETQLSFATWEEKAKNQIRRFIYDKDYTAWELKCRTAFKGLKKRKLKSHRSDQS